MLNRAILIGRLTKDVDLRYTPNGTAVASFTLAADRFRKSAQGEKETDFIPIVVWQKQAENCAEHLRKGSLAAIDGRIQVRNYADRNGEKRYVTEVVAEAVRFLDSRKTEGRQSNNQEIGQEVGFSAEDIPF